MRYLVGLILLFLGLLPLSCGKASDSSATQELQIVSPHGSAIKFEFEQAFTRWHQEHYGTPVKILWPTIGSNGTTEITKSLTTTYIDAKRPSSGYDIVFGGGSANFDSMAKSNFLEAPNPPLPASVLDRAATNVRGKSLRGPDNLWIAATMSNFGFVVNKTRLAELHLATPSTWKDLASPQWFGNLSLADPSKGSSVKTCFEMMLQQYGWQEGWPLLVRFFANAEAIQVSGSTPGDEAASGNAAAGIVIDFYGRTAIIKQGSATMAFIVPEGGSTLDPDPIAVLKGAPHPALASHFIEFVVSDAGQKLWIQRPGTPGGPERKALGRMSTIPDQYETQLAYLTDPANPFTSKTELKINARLISLRSPFIGETIKAALIDSHAELRAARQAVLKAGDPPELLAMFDELPFAETQTEALAQDWKDPAKRLALRNGWQKKYQALWQKIQAAAAAHH